MDNFGRLIDAAVQVMSTQFNLLGFSVSPLSILLFFALAGIILDLIYGIFK